MNSGIRDLLFTIVRRFLVEINFFNETYIKELIKRVITLIGLSRSEKT